MNLRTRLAILLGKSVSWVSKTFRLGAGATWPGEIALRINPQNFAGAKRKGAAYYFRCRHKRENNDRQND